MTQHHWDDCSIELTITPIPAQAMSLQCPASTDHSKEHALAACSGLPVRHPSGRIGVNSDKQPHQTIK
eukprot:12314321-Alexandrium_andersonii.AAC.1